MILKQEKEMIEIKREAPQVGTPYSSSNLPSVFYRYEPELSNCVAGYRKGKCNPYLEKLMRL